MDRLTRFEIEKMRSYDPNTEGPLTPTGLRIWQAICDRALSQEAVRDEVLEEAAKWWDDTEARSAEAHAVYQQEAHRRGDVRHADAYADLSEETKEWDRVLVRWVAMSLRALKREPNAANEK